jgi:hypothetical protein
VVISRRLKARQDGKMGADINITEKDHDKIFEQIQSLFGKSNCN